MDDSKVLVKGSSIKIKRTDGRVHPAYVAGIKYDSGTAAVEWFEQGETKGKEVDLAVIKSLNPEILIMQPQSPHYENGIERPRAVLKSPSRAVVQDSLESSEEENMGKSRQKIEDSDEEDLNSNQLSPNTATFSDVMRFTMAEPHEAPDINQPTNGQADHWSDPENVATSSRPSNIKKSNVVKEVEKLKKNREERRQRQAEEKAKEEAFLQKNPENPHWRLLNMINEYRKNIEIKPLTDSDAVEDHLITVCVRKRPLNKKEINAKEVDVITIPSKNQLMLHEPKNKVDLTKYLENQLFRFDYAFDESCPNEMVYKYTAQPLVQTIFEGGFATCFAYGQTGAGKTHTMGGVLNSKNPSCEKGIYTLVAADVFRLTKSQKYRQQKLLVSASFFEIYSGKVFDLLNKKAKLKILEDGKQQVQVVGLSEIAVNSVEEVLTLIKKGSQARTSGQTSANANSSRSHAVFQIYLRSMTAPQKVYGKFSLIDLAGNERGADTSSANRQTRMEGAEINKSLLALKECIRALGRKGAHLPFRVSKLTQVLRDSFVGSNSRTCMIAMVSPGLSSCEHTLNTLRYADRVKELGSGDLQSNQQADDGQWQDEAAGLSHLQSLNEHDMTPEMLNFHQLVSELQVAEDVMLDTHKQLSDDLTSKAEKFKDILRKAENTNFNGESYLNTFYTMVQNLINSDFMQKSIAVAKDYEAKLAEEEKLSRETNKKRLGK